ncbi:hypothetical protein D3C81_1596600 [compost metagenome]
MVQVQDILERTGYPHADRQLEEGGDGILHIPNQHFLIAIGQDGEQAATHVDQLAIGVFLEYLAKDIGDGVMQQMLAPKVVLL